MSWSPEIERRKYIRIPCKIDIKIKELTYNTIKNAQSINISNQGIQIVLNDMVRLYEPLEILLDPFYLTKHKTNSHNASYRAEVRWIKPNPFSHYKAKYLVGLKTLDNIDWHIPISKIEQRIIPSSLQLFLRILSLIDEKLILLNTKLEPIWINKKHDWHFLNINKKQTTPLDVIFNLNIYSKTLKTFMLDTIKSDNCNTILIPSFNLMASNRNKINIPFNLLIIPLLDNNKKLRYILIRININNQFDPSENMNWLDYRYLHIGRLLDCMLEEIVNPISAVIGRLDLLDLRLDNLFDKLDKLNDEYNNDYQTIKKNIQIIKKHINSISKICKSTLKDKDTDLLQNLEIFSLSDLIKREVDNIKIHKSFKDIDIKLILNLKLPYIHGNYELWALAIKSLIQKLQKRMKHIKNKKIVIETFYDMNKIFIKITHTGKQLKTNIANEHDLSIFQVLTKEYPLKIYIDGPSGNQIILLELSLIVTIDNNSLYYSKRLSAIN